MSLSPPHLCNHLPSLFLQRSTQKGQSPASTALSNTLALKCMEESGQAMETALSQGEAGCVYTL